MRTGIEKSIKTTLAKAVEQNQWEFICSIMDDSEMDHSSCDNPECDQLFKLLYDASCYTNFNQFLYFLLEKAREYHADDFKSEIDGKIFQQLGDVEDKIEKNNFKLDASLAIELLTCLDFCKIPELKQLYISISSLAEKDFLLDDVVVAFQIALLKLKIQRDEETIPEQPKKIIEKMILIVNATTRNLKKSCELFSLNSVNDIVNNALHIHENDKEKINGVMQNACESYVTYYQAVHGKMPVALDLIGVKIIMILCDELRHYPNDWIPSPDIFFADYIARSQKPAASVFDGISAFFTRPYAAMNFPSQLVTLAIKSK